MEASSWNSGAVDEPLVCVSGSWRQFGVPFNGVAAPWLDGFPRALCSSSLDGTCMPAVRCSSLGDKG